VRVPLLAKFGYAVVFASVLSAPLRDGFETMYTLFSYQNMGARISANSTGAPLEEAL
jgi:hypothetical protein